MTLRRAFSFWAGLAVAVVLPLRTLSDRATSDTVHLRRVLARRLVLEMLSLFRCENSDAVERVDFFSRLLTSSSDDAANAMVAEGMRISPRPPHRSRRALLTHRAPPSGSGVEAVTWQRV